MKPKLGPSETTKGRTIPHDSTTGPPLRPFAPQFTLHHGRPDLRRVFLLGLFIGLLIGALLGAFVQIGGM